MSKPQPVPAQLSPAVRAQLASVFDVQAAEQFFRTMSQADANRVLSDMGVVVGHPPAETQRVIVPVASSDPAMQAVIDRMWAPSQRVASGESGGPIPRNPAPAVNQTGRLP